MGTLKRSPRRDGPQFDLVVIGASLGGIPVLREVLAGLPADFGAPVAIVQHRSPRFHSDLGRALGASARIRVKEAARGELLSAGTAYVAPNDRHLLIGQDGRVELSEAPFVRVRPAVDPLFKSAADTFGPRVVGVVLTGMLRDGAAGVLSIKSSGGRVFVQNPDDCVAPDMPRAALATGCVDLALAPNRIASALVALVMVPGAADLFRVPMPPWAQTAMYLPG